MSTPLGQQLVDAKNMQANIAALPAPVIAPPNFGGAPPVLPAPTLPSVQPNQVLGDEDKFNTIRSSAPGVAQIHNPFLRGVARTADVLGSVFLPGLSAAIPGTTAHHNLLVSQAQQNLANDQATAQKQAQTDNLNAQPQLKEQAAELAEEKLHSTEQHQQAALDQQRQLQLARNGQMETTGPDGQKHIVDDPDSQVFQGRKVLSDYHAAQIGLDQARAELAKAGNDPTSPAYRLALAKEQTAQQNANAAGVRAQSYMGRYLQSAYNKGLGGDTLPGAPQIESATGAVTPVGTGNASQAVKAQANVAKFNDVHGALDNIENSAKQLVSSGGSLNSPGIIYAMQHVHGTPSEFVQSLDKANLSPAERQYVIAVEAGRENIQALRGAVGSGISDSQIDRLENMIPNGSTPDINYLLNQTGQIRQTAERLGKGVTTVSGGIGVRGGNANNGPKEGETKVNAAGDKVKFHNGAWGPA